MSKRYTESEKWRDAWFAGLTPHFKLAWLYLCDACDQAGVFDVVPQNDTAALGERIDWDAFILASGGRVERLSANKLWLVRFIDFQQPRGLNPKNKAHGPAIRSVERNGLSDRVPIGGDRTPRQGCSEPPQVKVKATVTVKEKEDAREPPDVPAELHEIVGVWLEYKAGRKESPGGVGLKQLFGTVRNRARDHGCDTVREAMQTAMANGWKGWDFGFNKQVNRGSESRTAKALRNLEGMSNGDTANGSEGGGARLRLAGPPSR